MTSPRPGEIWGHGTLSLWLIRAIVDDSVHMHSINDSLKALCSWPSPSGKPYRVHQFNSGNWKLVKGLGVCANCEGGVVELDYLCEKCRLAP